MINLSAKEMGVAGEGTSAPEMVLPPPHPGGRKALQKQNGFTHEHQIQFLILRVFAIFDRLSQEYNQ